MPINKKHIVYTYISKKHTVHTYISNKHIVCTSSVHLPLVNILLKSWRPLLVPSWPVSQEGTSSPW